MIHFSNIIFFIVLVCTCAAVKGGGSTFKTVGKFNTPRSIQTSTKRLNNIVHNNAPKPLDANPTPTPTTAPTTATSSSSTYQYPPCIHNESELIFINEMISATQTIDNCIANIPDPYSIPTFYNGSYQGSMKVFSNIQINNLHDVDAITGTITIDFYLRLFWKDNRFNMPLFWDQLDNSTQAYGVDLTKLVDSNYGNAPFWLPDIRFHDAASIDVIVDAVRVNASNIIFWSQHILMTLIQPKFNFFDYPTDDQMIHIRYGSYSYNQTFLTVQFLSPSLTFNQNFDGSYTFLSNPFWTYQHDESSYGQYLSSNGFLNKIYHIAITRQGIGIIVRLILPIALLIYLSGLTFWAEYETRVNTTSTLLFSVSALYVVILQNIPLLGYLTKVDLLVVAYYLMLVLAIVLHQMVDRAIAKVDHFPLRRIYLRCVEFIGRTTSFPTVTFLYVISMQEITPHSHAIMIFLTAIVVTAILIREWSAFKQEIRRGLDEFIIKLNDPYTKFADLTFNEIVFFNAWRLHIISFSTVYMEEMLIEDGCIVGPPSWGVFDDHTKERKHLQEGIKEHHLSEPAFAASGIAAAEEAKHGEESLIHPHHHHHKHHKKHMNDEEEEAKEMIITNTSKNSRLQEEGIVVVDDERIEETRGQLYSLERIPSFYDTYFADSGGQIGHRKSATLHL